MKQMWNERYAAEEYAYGEAPNAFLKQFLDTYQPRGNILLPAEGEGRNAVYAAKIGLSVFAFDISEEGKKKALALAQREKVSIDYKVLDMSDIALKDSEYDAVALVFAHFPSSHLHEYHRKIAKTVKPGGFICLEAFALGHEEFQRSNPKAGGPKDTDMLFTTELIKRDFPEFTQLLLEECEVKLLEGKFHDGKSKVLRFIGKKM
ncbi:class I SAM-dependent methyltransferase [Alteromonas sp. W364]|uniref:class I SAM-dependent methyltransferase n=1 Tax=Alteromonas sp. W364 TaxID=3075610 RepID=UPI002887132F|nr:class I SAM-dependent methyltransferase [Alteromonas sp. W364]MDT0629269.1 class I SAM-dependent methyltransferase [Alteromonas sp. W364]